MTRDELIPPHVTRDQSEWEQAPCSIKGGASHPGYWATSDGETSSGFPLAAILGSLQVCFEFREKPRYPIKHC